jgi:hypothetical protein
MVQCAPGPPYLWMVMASCSRVLAVSGPNWFGFEVWVFSGLRDFLVGTNPHNVQTGVLIFQHLPAYIGARIPRPALCAPLTTASDLDISKRIPSPIRNRILRLLSAESGAQVFHGGEMHSVSQGA